MKNRNDASVLTPADLLNDLRSLVVEAEKMTAASIGEHTEEALDSLRERFVAAQERCADLYAGARKKVIAGAKYTDETIRENPYQSLAVAVGVGVVIGVLVGRSTK